MILRHQDAAFIFDCIADGDCASIVGVSNIGKSYLLRSICHPAAFRAYLGKAADECALVYVDFNLMLNMTEQGFYERILRTILDEFSKLAGDEAPGLNRELAGILARAYEGVVNPSNPFQIPLSFNESIIAICEGSARRLALLFDEFDEVFQGIDDRVYLNLRALRDRYQERLCYIVATGELLRDIRQSPQAAEFAELFARRTYYLPMLNESDTIRFIETYDTGEGGVAFSLEDVRFIAEQAGGHPGLLQATSYVVAQALKEEGPEQARRHAHRSIRARLDNDLSVRTESAKLWNGLTLEEQDALIAFLNGDRPPAEAKRQLQQKGILISQSGRETVFGQLFAGFAHRQGLVRSRQRKGVRIDVDAGTVWVDGERVPNLTDLEHRLLLLLYGRLDKIVSKYEIVEAVWGQDYIETVDDVRIDKLVSRLRAKLEPNPAKPTYLQTVRSRGYSLVTPKAS
jgi:hypothetical protein